MSSFSEYVTLSKHIKNWPVYFKRKLINKHAPVQFITKGVPVTFEVPRELYGVFKEIFLQDFYKVDNLVKFIPENAVVVDVGANAGYFSMFILSKIKGAKIYAFEPVDKNFNLFNKNKSFNQKLVGQLHLFKKALTGSVTGKIDFFVDNSENNNSVIGSIYGDFSRDNNAVQQSDAISLIDFMKSENINRIDLLKLDCEGSEYPILYETPASVWNNINTLAIEVHDMDDEKRNLNELDRYLKSLNYKTSFFKTENNCSSLLAWKN
jgi:FkbM family methyltransferase